VTIGKLNNYCPGQEKATRPCNDVTDGTSARHTPVLSHWLQRAII